MADDLQQAPPVGGTYQMPSQITQDLQDNALQIVRVLTEHESFLEVIRREMRGEQREDPIRIIANGSQEYICNEEAINEILSILKMCGLNPIAPLTNITNDEILEDLLEMECKIAMLLAVNRKKWGLNKAEYPIAVGKLKVLIKDARYRAKDGTVLRALRTMTTRMEQSAEVKKEKPSIGGMLN